jgi:transcriptional regulator with XRE-family HTH domain
MLEKGIHSSTGKPIMITPEILLKFSAAYDYPYNILSMKAGVANFRNGLISELEGDVDSLYGIDSLLETSDIVGQMISEITDEHGNVRLSLELEKDTLGERIIELRQTKNYTQIDLTNLLKPFYNSHSLQRESFTIEQIESYENDEVEPPLRFIIALSDLFNVSTDWILKGKDFVIKSDTQNEEEQMLEMVKKLEDIVKEKYKSDPNS